MPIPRLLLAGLAAIAAVLAVPSAATPSASPALLAYRSGELIELQPLSLQPIRMARVPVPQVDVSWSLAPKRDFVALGGLERLVLFDLGTWRTRLSVHLPSYAYVAATAWRKDGLRVLLDEERSLELMTLDPSSGRVLRSRRLARTVVAAAVYRGDIVAITAPAGSIGRARLLVLRAGAPARLIGLGGIVAGESGNRRVVPALSVVGSLNRAFVVGTNGALAAVDLTRGTVRYQSPRQVSAAQKGLISSVRRAVWLGRDRLAVAGWTERNRPAGLALLDVRSGSVRVLDRSTDSLAAGGSALLGYRFAFPPSRAVPGGGVTVYSASGRRRFHLLGDSTIAAAAIIGTRAYIDQDELRVLVVDLRSGRTVATARGELPQLLAGTPSWPPAP